jgi:hypothetical protein
MEITCPPKTRNFDHVYANMPRGSTTTLLNEDVHLKEMLVAELDLLQQQAAMDKKQIREELRELRNRIKWLEDRAMEQQVGPTEPVEETLSTLTSSKRHQRVFLQPPRQDPNNIMIPSLHPVLNQQYQHRLGELFTVQREINAWYRQDCEKIKLQARAEELNKAEPVRIYHHELHSKKIKRTSILKLDTGDKIIHGHTECTQFLEKSISDLLLHPATLCEAAQNALLREVDHVFTEVDNSLLSKFPDKEEVKESVWSSNPHAAPGTDGLTAFLYKSCWNTLGDALTEMVQAVHSGRV